MTVDELLARLRQAAASLDEAGPPPPVVAPWPAAGPGAGGAPGPGAVQDAVLQAAKAGPLGWGGVLALPEAAFVEAAYGLTLGRPADAQGRADARAALGAGLPRLGLLMRLHDSPEARQRRGGARRWSDAVAAAAGAALHTRLPGLPALARLALRGLEGALAARARPALALAQAAAGAADGLLAAQGQALARTAQALEGAQRRLSALEGQAQRDSTPPASVQAYLQALETHFRGDPAALQAQMAADYGPALAALQAAHPQAARTAPCLDLGCGRGVWLELLEARGFVARGMDLNPGPVAEAQARGLDARVGDALAWLRAQPEGSALMVTAFHLVEHLPFVLRFELVAEAARVLRPGGLLILETPNPENVWVATHTFHHDPTHGQPLTPASLAFLVAHLGLEAVELLRLHPMPGDAGLPVVDATSARLNHMTCGAQDFAVLARKPGAPGPNAGAADGAA